MTNLRCSGLLRALNTALGLQPRRGKADLLLQFHAAVDDLPKQLVLLLDEAHLFQLETLEELRLLTNTHFDSQAPFTRVLAGQPALRDLLGLASMASLNQRVTVRYRLTGLSKDETFAYLSHHLQRAGAKHNILADEVVTAIFHASRGLPRVINNLTTACLIAAASQNRKDVDLQLYQDAIADIENS